MDSTGIRTHYLNLITLNPLFGIEESFQLGLGLSPVIDSSGTGGFTSSLFLVSFFGPGSEGEGGGRGGGETVKGRGRQEPKPEHETMTLEVTHSYPELRGSERKD